MRIAQTYDDYLKGKTSCDDVVSWAEVFAKWLLQSAAHSNKVVAMLPRDSSVDYYQYEVSPSGQISLKEWKNAVPSSLLSVLEMPMLSDSKTRLWWNNVFYQDERGIHYDEYYDDLRIAEKSRKTFAQFLDAINDEFSSLRIPKVRQLFLPPKIAEHQPLLYVLQKKKISVSTIPDLYVPSIQDSSLSFENRNHLILNAGGGIPVEELFNRLLTIQVPNAQVTLEAEALPGIKWCDVVSGSKFYFSSGGVDYVETNIGAEIDVFGNVFIIVLESGKKTKCILV